MMTEGLKRYSLGVTDWYLMEEGLKVVVAHLAGKDKERRYYGTFDYQGGRVFIKSFLEAGFAGRIRHLFAPRGKREFAIGNRLAALSIPTPAVLGYGIGRNSSSIIEEYIEGQSLLDAIKKTSDRDTLFSLLAGLLAQLTIKHVRHNDLHLDNVLIRGDKLYLIDLHKTKVKKYFHEDDEVSNVTHALGIIYDDISERERDYFFHVFGCSETVRRRIEREIATLRKEWVASKKDRAFKNTSLLKAHSGEVRIRDSEEMAHGEFVATLKKDKKVRVDRFSDHIRKVYRHGRRLRTAWRNHVVFKYLESAAVPRPFYVKLPTLFSSGYVAMEDLGHKGIELDRFLDVSYDGMTYPEKRRFVQELSLFLGAIMRQRISHRDMKACNIFTLHEGGFVLLDVEDIVFGEVEEKALKRMLVQLNTTVPVRIAVRDRMRFFLKLTSWFKIDRRRLFGDIREESLACEIVYEGASGLKKERWH
ncbi:MAG TPA: lipopolysaccharide kinase InaA family protein [Syntrophorhabdaceae bacterium]|nr:lipopolysaccharide kinase InaA family protein [Syntrophorhabdaceae bacterium]